MLDLESVMYVPGTLVPCNRGQQVSTAHQLFKGIEATQALNTCDHVVLQKQAAQIGELGETQCFYVCQLVLPKQQDMKVGE